MKLNKVTKMRQKSQLSGIRQGAGRKAHIFQRGDSMNYLHSWG